ncbi:hypothetical protein L1049_010925 [Liquidambar formosana]|uniref:Chaperonin-like RbcX protein 2, chloroplastic n=1 Tax=Liquidambar formosana TaxID=63359 RepID=A0AAP0RQZ2_LIQFO
MRGMSGGSLQRCFHILLMGFQGSSGSSGALGIVDELGGQYEDTFNDVKRQILNYFTYKAVRTVLHQLYEMNPSQYTWFYNFIASNKPGDGKRFIRTLGKEKQELAERVMVTRLHLYGKWVKKCDHAEIYKEISDENLELMRERLMETCQMAIRRYQQRETWVTVALSVLTLKLFFFFHCCSDCPGTTLQKDKVVYDSKGPCCKHFP